MKDQSNTLNLTLLHTGYAHLNNLWNYQNVISPFVRIILMTKGRADLILPNKTFILKPGYMYLIPSYINNSYKCDDYHEHIYCGFFEELKSGHSIFNLRSFENEVKITNLDKTIFERLVKLNPNKYITDSTPKPHIKNNLLNTSTKTNTKTKIETQAILEYFISKFLINRNENKSSLNTKNNLIKILPEISTNLNTDIKISHLAEYCDLNTDYFSKKFLEYFGMRPNKYIQLKRIERAQILLLSTKKTMKQIAEEVGLFDVPHFSKTFKRITGNTPGKFRKGYINF
ncbi:hypothetical protein GCM10023314_28400 [Algibacter agarivorans]|uniref:HTH araC/xylS-type domain-containing protein n=1 Tax=Algibacter agarivorans TaxID=1109741 RepID=A0ABP9GTI6_9FLAO